MGAGRLGRVGYDAIPVKRVFYPIASIEIVVEMMVLAGDCESRRDALCIYPLPLCLFSTNGRDLSRSGSLGRHVG
jgi:hypothetical protein